MLDKDAATPRVYLIRHGQTEWTINGRHTSTTELPLTAEGEKQVAAAGKLLVGPGKSIDPARLAHVFVSPRVRAKQTFELVFDDHTRRELAAAGKVTETQKIVEWDFGRYEGQYREDIRAGRKQRGLDQDRPWSLNLDGCEDGESPQQVTERLDSLIRDIKTFHVGHMQSPSPADIVICAHGVILRALTKRWLGLELSHSIKLMMMPGAVGVLSYYNNDINTPALFVGLDIPSS